MSLKTGLAIALRRVRAHRLRSALTATGILVGVAAAMLLIGVDGAVSRTVRGQIASLGSDVVTVYPVSSSSSGVLRGFGTGASLTPGDVQALSDPGRVPDARQVVTGAGLHTPVSAMSRVWTTDVFGTSDTFAEVRGYEITRGEFLNAANVNASASVAVIGQTVADKVFAGDDPVGQVIRINRHPFKVIGLFHPKGGFDQSNQDDLVVVPITTAWAYLLPKEAPHIQQILLQASNAKATAAVAFEARQVLMQRHHITDPGQADFQIITTSELVARTRRVATLLKWLLLTIALTALLSGGIAIANLMASSVLQRVREIGVRRALGAQRRDILLQFLIEALALAGLGAVGGLLAAVVLTAVIPGIAPDLPAPQLSIASVLVALAVTVAVGSLAGVYPALLAARVQPMEALRYP